MKLEMTLEEFKRYVNVPGFEVDYIWIKYDDQVALEVTPKPDEPRRLDFVWPYQDWRAVPVTFGVMRDDPPDECKS